MNPKIIDSHMHSNYSPDADPKATFEAYIEKAKRLGIKSLVFTDHVDFDSPAEIFTDMIDYDAYVKHLNEVKNTTDIQLLLGVEMGYQPHLHQRIDDFLSKYPFDFVIMSMHIGDGLDFYNGDFFKGKTQVEAYQRYFEIVLDSVRNYQNYDVYGHIDYIIRYGGYPNKRYLYETHKETISAILKEIIKHGKGIEINTSGLRYGLGLVHPYLELLKEYKALGGKIVTFGSDAHFVKDYYAGFEESIKLLKDAGFEYVTVYRNRKPEFIKI